MTTKVRVLEAFEIVTPATVLETHVAGEVVNRIDVPESRHAYQAGHVFTFGRKSAARDFAKCYPGKVQVLP